MAIGDKDVREQHLTTPFSLKRGAKRMAPPAQGQQLSSQMTAAPRPSQPNHPPGRKDVKKARRLETRNTVLGAAKAGWNHSTPDGRQICYKFNDLHGNCKGECNRVHVCAICLDPGHKATDPAHHSSSASTGKGAGKSKGGNAGKDTRSR